MKRQIVTVSCQLPEWFEKHSLPRMEESSKRWDANLVVIKPEKPIGLLAKMSLVDAVQNADRTLFVDSDVLISRECVNPFETFPQGHFYACADAPHGDQLHWGRANEMILSQAMLGSVRWTQGYFNTGVMVCDRQHAGAWANFVYAPFAFPEQTFTNYRARMLGYSIRFLSWEWNAMEINTPKDKKQSDGFMPHAAGIYGDARAKWIEEMDKVLP